MICPERNPLLFDVFKIWLKASNIVSREIANFQSGCSIFFFVEVDMPVTKPRLGGNMMLFGGEESLTTNKRHVVGVERICNESEG